MEPQPNKLQTSGLGDLCSVSIGVVKVCVLAIVILFLCGIFREPSVSKNTNLFIVLASISFNWSMNPRSMDPWIPGTTGSWIHGSMDPWIHGSMEPWIRGSFDAN